MTGPRALPISLGDGLELVSGVGTVTGTGIAWVPGETVDARIERLWNRLDQTDALLAQTRVEANNDKQTAVQALTSARVALQEQHDQLTARVTDNQQAALATDRRVSGPCSGRPGGHCAAEVTAPRKIWARATSGADTRTAGRRPRRGVRAP